MGSAMPGTLKMGPWLRPEANRWSIQVAPSLALGSLVSDEEKGAICRNQRIRMNGTQWTVDSRIFGTLLASTHILQDIFPGIKAQVQCLMERAFVS